MHWLFGCESKAYYLQEDPEYEGQVLTVGLFLGDSNPYLHEFRRKLQTACSTNVTGV